MGNEREYYSAEEFRDGCLFNRLIGGTVGFFFGVMAFITYAWVHNWY